ncbi:hypothetical protein H261_07818 [Paramagnetospirillum caucaseum]|uniref:Uncharacterized protein n=1 Tax=Paramagnetospirillum caucaseum TaxID=1244869 RepID=M2Z886_9PROT|nr:hypothetical protein H261_07818 [Paramagnetospirillum caucaseum]
MLNDLERLAFGLAVAALGLHLAVFAVGHWRLDPLGMGLVAGAFILGAIPGLRAMPWAAWRGLVTASVRGSAGHRFEALLWVLILGIALSALLQGLAPPNDYDSLMYHLSIPLYDVAKGWMEIAWGWHNRNFFPILVENLARFALVFSGTGAAQMMHGLLGLGAAMMTAALARRLGGGRKTALAAALMFLSVRVVVWEMATLEVEVAQALYCGGALLAYMLLRRQGGYGLACLFGLMLAGAFHVKYTSLLYAGAFAPIMLWDLFRRRMKIGPWLTGPLVTLAIFVPHLARNLAMTGNPLFPLLNPVFNKGGPAFMEDAREQYGVGRDLLSHLEAPWAFSVDPLRNFDGVILGAPYLLALVPFAFLGRRRARDVVPAVAVALGFYLGWFHLISQQVRFLAPLFPLLAGLAALGAASLWEEAGASRPLRLGLATLFLVLAATQSMFVGIYTVLRLPVALGLQSVETYLTTTPTMDGSHYLACKYLTERLQPGQRYLSMLQPHFATCPTTSAVIWLPGEEKAWMTGKLPTYSTAEFLAKLDEADIRYVIVQSRFENRRNADARAEMRTAVLSGDRIAKHIVPALDSVQPLFSDKFADVYDGVEIREALRRRLRAGG